MPSAVVLSHDWIAHELGHLEPWLAQNDFTIDRIYRESPREIPAADLLIVLGSPDSVAGETCPPATSSEVAAIGDWLATGRPYLGICFGAQVLARAAGGAVKRLDAPFHAYTGMQTQERALAGPWMLYHNDAIAAPADSAVLAQLPHADLAFSIGRAWGIQPHIEVDAQILDRMLRAVGGDDAEISQIVAAVQADQTHSDRAAQLLSAFATAALG